MGTKEIKIAIIEDSEFYNSLLTKQLRYYTNMLELESDYKYRFHIQSYTHAEEFIKNLKEDLNIAFIDYYLGDSITGSELIKEIKNKCENCKIIVMSQVRNMKTAFQSITEGAFEFVFKDTNALPKSCFILEDVLKEN